MTEYISDVVKIFNMAEISWSDPEKFEISVSYGINTTFSVSKSTLTTTLTITNFTGNTPFNAASDIICEVGSSVDNMIDITTLTDPSFGISVSSVDPTQYNVTVTINSENPDLYKIIIPSSGSDYAVSLGNLKINFRLSESFLTALENDGYDVLTWTSSPDYAFRTNFGNPPKSIITSQPQNATYSGGSSTFQMEFDTYNGSIAIGSSWQYSDNYPIDPENATWSDVTGDDGSYAGGSSSTSGSWGFGENSGSPDVDSHSRSLTISQSQYQQNPHRRYRYKYVVV
jgi:hypothetical protein